MFFVAATVVGCQTYVANLMLTTALSRAWRGGDDQGAQQGDDQPQAEQLSHCGSTFLRGGADPFDAGVCFSRRNMASP